MKGWRNFAAAAFLLISACSSSQEKASELAATAAALYDAGNYTAARLIILKANAARDDVAEQWVLQGRIELAMNDPVNAYQAYQRALDLDATNQEALQLVAEVGFQVGRMREAGNSADRLLALNPNATRAILVKGLIALEGRRLPEAAGFADRILALNPNDEGGVVLKARALALDGKRQEAIDLLKEKLPGAVPAPAITSTLLEIYRSNGDLTNMLPLFETLVNRSPENRDLQIDFANTLYKSGNAERARDILLKIMAAQPEDNMLLGKITALWDEYDDQPLSPGLLEQMQKEASLPIRLNVARYFLAHGKTAQAGALLSPIAATARDPSLADIRSLYARTLDASGQSAEAAAIINAVLQDDTNNADALLLRAQQALRRNDTRAAINDAQIVVRDYPDNTLGYITLAQVLDSRSETWRVRQVYEQAINDFPQNYALVSSFVTFLYRIGDKPRAMSVAREFVLANPASLRGWDLLSSACARLNDSNCLSQAKAGRDKAAHTYAIDERPGASRRRGLFGKL